MTRQNDTSIANIDFDQAWVLCGQDGPAPQTFVEQVTSALHFYSVKRTAAKRPTKREVGNHFQKLEKTAQTLIDAMSDTTEKYGYILYHAYEDALPDHMSNDDFEEKAVGTEYEGLHLYEAHIERLQTRLGTLIKTAQFAPKYIDTDKGRPKLNYFLESTLRDLGQVYQEATGRAPMDGYSYSDIEGTYQGPFLDFATHILWSFAGKDIPTKTVIGDAARTAFGLRK